MIELFFFLFLTTTFEESNISLAFQSSIVMMPMLSCSFAMFVCGNPVGSFGVPTHFFFFPAICDGYLLLKIIRAQCHFGVSIWNGWNLILKSVFSFFNT